MNLVAEIQSVLVSHGLVRLWKRIHQEVLTMSKSHQQLLLAVLRECPNKEEETDG